MKHEESRVTKVAIVAYDVGVRRAAAIGTGRMVYLQPPLHSTHHALRGSRQGAAVTATPCSDLLGILLGSARRIPRVAAEN